MPCAGLGDFGPEKAKQLITAATTFPGRCKYCKERQPPALVPVIAQDSLVLRSGEPKCSERLQAETRERGRHFTGPGNYHSDAGRSSDGK